MDTDPMSIPNMVERAGFIAILDKQAILIVRRLKSGLKGQGANPAIKAMDSRPRDALIGLWHLGNICVLKAKGFTLLLQWVFY
jgi:hypothetical protein